MAYILLTCLLNAYDLPADKWCQSKEIDTQKHCEFLVNMSNNDAVWSKCIIFKKDK